MWLFYFVFNMLCGLIQQNTVKIMVYYEPHMNLFYLIGYELKTHLNKKDEEMFLQNQWSQCLALLQTRLNWFACSSTDDTFAARGTIQPARQLSILSCSADGFTFCYIVLILEYSLKECSRFNGPFFSKLNLICTGQSE